MRRKAVSGRKVEMEKMQDMHINDCDEGVVPEVAAKSYIESPVLQVYTASRSCRQRREQKSLLAESNEKTFYKIITNCILEKE